MKKTAVLVSGGGTNLQEFIDAEKRGGIKSVKITCVSEFAPERAKKKITYTYRFDYRF